MTGIELVQAHGFFLPDDPEGVRLATLIDNELAAMTQARARMVDERMFFEKRIVTLEQQLAAMTQERDELAKDCDDLRALAERLMARLSENKVMVDDIKIMGEL